MSPPMFAPLHQVKRWVVWFRFVGSELEKAPDGLTTEELAGAARRKRGEDADDKELVKGEARKIAQLLSDLSEWGLVTGDVVTRTLPEPPHIPSASLPPVAAGRRAPTPPPRITSIPAYVAKLQERGSALLKAPAWRQHLFFATRLVVGLKLWKPLGTALTIAGAIATILKLFLLWQSHHTAIAAGLAAILIFFVQLLRARPV